MLNLRNLNISIRLLDTMLTAAKKLLLIFMAFSLMITQINSIFASQINASAMTMSGTSYEEGISNHSTHKNQKDSSSKHSAKDTEKCTCKTDCEHANCTSSCSDCSHSVLGIINANNHFPTIHSSNVSQYCQTLYQEAFMVQYRPPKSLQS